MGPNQPNSEPSVDAIKAPPAEAQAGPGATGTPAEATPEEAHVEIKPAASPDEAAKAAADAARDAIDSAGAPEPNPIDAPASPAPETTPPPVGHVNGYDTSKDNYTSGGGDRLPARPDNADAHAAVAAAQEAGKPVMTINAQGPAPEAPAPATPETPAAAPAPAAEQPPAKPAGGVLDKIKKLFG